MQTSDLRIALFSGNYNMTVDGANKALNRLVGYLLKQGAQVRVYSPTICEPAMKPTGDLVSVPSIAIPGRPEYRLPLRLSARVKQDLEAFAPNIVHLSAPDRVSRQAAKWAQRQNLPVICSVHTRFETYFRYYNLAFIEEMVVAWLRKLYRQCDALVAPSQAFVDDLKQQRMNDDISIWSRGVDRTIFSSERRDLSWRREIGIADDMPVIGFLGRLVMEKGLDDFAATIAELERRQIRHMVVVIGDGPAGNKFRASLPAAKFLGFRAGAELARAVAGFDMLLNPSITEGFSNVSLETMSCGVPVIAANATGNVSMFENEKSGLLITPGAIDQYADAIEFYCENPVTRKKHGAEAEKLTVAYDWDSINQVVAEKYIALIRQKAGVTNG